MHSLLEKLLKKRNIKDVRELDVEEQNTFDKWNKILSTSRPEWEDLEVFIKEQLNKAIQEVANPDNSSQKDAKLKAAITIFQSLLGFIQSPRADKETLEKYLNQLITQ